MTLDRRALLLAAPVALACLGAARAAAAEPGRELVFADVRVNGRAGSFMVDTGAPTSVIDKTFADKAGVKLGEGSTLRGAGGHGAVRGYIADSVKMEAGGGPSMILDPAVADLSPIGVAMGRPLDGLLGGDYFARMILTLDYRTGETRFAEPGAARPPADAVPLHIISTPYVRAAAEHGGKRVQAAFQIDTGSNTAVEFWTPFARRAFPKVEGETVDSVGIAGESHKRMARLDVFEVAGQRFTGLEANFADTLRPDDAGPDYAGIIGGPVFTGRIVTLDYDRSKFWLR